MGAKKTAWHPPFTGLLQERCPRWAKVTGEVQLTAEPLRVDDVIEVWVDRPHDPLDTGGTLRGMWRFIVVVGLLEYKSVVWPFQHGDLSRLLAYGLLWRATHQRRAGRGDGSRTERLAAHEITLLLAVPSLNDPLRDELDDLGLTLPASTTGYHQVPFALLPLVVVDLHVVAELEDDDLLRGFAGRPQRTLEARRWMRQHWSGTGDPMGTNATPDLYGYDEFIEQYLRDLTPMQRLKGLAPEERLKGLAPEERLKGLAPEERLKGLAPHPTLEIEGHQDRVSSAAFSHDGSRIVTASEDKTARVWSANGTGKPLLLEGHQDIVYSGAFSRDGTRIVTASEDKTARVWSADGTGKPLLLAGHSAAVFTGAQGEGAFSPDGAQIPKCIAHRWSL